MTWPGLERLPRRRGRDSRLPDIRLALYDTAVLIDSRAGTIELWSWDLTGEGRSAALERRQSWRRSIERSIDSPRAHRIRRSTFDNLTASLDRASYLEKAVRVLEYIAAGDVFQVNLSQRFLATGCPDRAGHLPAAEGPEPRALCRVSALGRPRGCIGEPGVVLPDARAHDRDAPDQGNAPARMHTGRR